MELIYYYKNPKFKNRRFFSRNFVFMRKIAYANAQGYVCYHRLLFKIHQNRYYGNTFVVDYLISVPLFCRRVYYSGHGILATIDI
jgi:hypothetical protein